MNFCVSCEQDFSTVPSFDAHRVGTHEYTYSEGINKEPMREDGRRCLNVEEMVTARWEKDRHGRWLAPNVAAREPRDPVLQRVRL